MLIVPQYSQSSFCSPLAARLDTLHGYILLAQTISESFDSRFHSFNFGPDPSSSQSVLALVERAFHTWPGSYISNDTLHNHETSFLTLSSHKAATMLSGTLFFLLTRLLI